MRVQVSGYRDGQRWPPKGESIDVPADEAGRLVDNGYAVKGGGSVETVTETPPETAAPAKKAAAKRPVKKGSK